MNTFTQYILFFLLASLCAATAHFYFSVSGEFAFIPFYALLIWRLISLAKNRSSQVK
ncbi:hypothetical protein [Alkalimarinus sediminis]|uniref:Uncharacterized protein n=1 Tax=Alkalimarinus sediminis TaxID=1632866 RepID=A0A9E8HL90_9ALTE|nr:hypothetical protein [Alkalimarinus sediminis]UZW76680.1 hypothetical protein NNL22_08890 [Alkalimarinus sediminis]